MPQFILAHGCAQSEGEFNKRPAFVRGYVTCLFFTENSPQCYTEEFEALVAAGKEIPEGSFPADCTPDDLSEEAWAQIEEDCAKFQEAAATLLEQAYAADYSEEQAGFDFWFTRNGHGVGFWDRDQLKPKGAEVEAIQAKMRAEGTTPDEWATLLAKLNALPGADLGDKLSDVANEFGECYVTYDDGKIWTN